MGEKWESSWEMKLILWPLLYSIQIIQNKPNIFVEATYYTTVWISSPRLPQASFNSDSQTDGLEILLEVWSIFNINPIGYFDNASILLIFPHFNRSSLWVIKPKINAWVVFNRVQ